MNQPKSNPASTDPLGNAGKTNPHLKSKKNRRIRRSLIRSLLVVTGAALIIGGSAAAGGWAGYRSGIHERQTIASQVASLSLQEQYNLAIEDLANSRYDLARQRLEYILNIDPAYPGVQEKLAEAMAVLYATATPTLLPPTITPTPTRDLRPVEELLAQARSLIAAMDWNTAIDTLLALRKADPNYETAKVDGLLFIALRQRGFDKIWKEGNLEGGIYDLTLAARIGPIDAASNSARDLARLYLFGSSFWEVYPAEAVNWFSQVAAAAPGLRDASGWTAAARYAQSLVHYGDLLMNRSQPCEAQIQYELAINAGAQGAQEKRDEALLRCSPPTNTPQPTTPGATTPPPAETTPPPPATTEPPVQTTAPPVQTTQPPVVTTQPPVETTQPPIQTTEPPPYPGL